MKATKFHLLLWACILATANAMAQQFPTFDWARVANEGYPAIPSISGNYSSSVRVVKRDGAGNIYLAGDLDKAMKFANQSIYGQNIYGANNQYIMKLNPTGETIVWVKTMLNGGIRGFSIDTDGFIYATGNMPEDGSFKYGAATVAGGTSYSTIIADDAIFLKINAADGNLVWVKNANNLDNYDNFPLIQSDATAIYATDGLGPNRNNSTTNNGYRIIKTLKSVANTDPDNFIETKAWVLDKTWVRANIDSRYENFVLDMKLSNNKQSLWLYLKTGDAWIDNFSGAFTDTREPILVRLDDLGNATPTVGVNRKMPTLICPDKGDLVVDSQGNVLITGTFGTSPGRYTPNANGNAVVTFAGVNYEFPMNTFKQFIAKFSPTGQEVWIKFFEPLGFEPFRSLTLDASDNIYVGGNATDNNQYATIGAYTSVNDAMFIMKLKPDGNQVYMWSNEESNSIGGDPVLCATGTDGVLIGTGGTIRRLPDPQAYFKVGTKEVLDGGGFVLSNLKHSGTAKPFEELKRLKNLNTGLDLQYGNSSSFPTKFTELGGNLVFFGWGGPDLNKSCYLWKTNGTEASTTALAEIYNENYQNEGGIAKSPYSGETVKTPTHLYFEGQSKVPNTTQYQREIWKSDGTVAGTAKIKSFLGGNQGDGGTKESLYDIRDIAYSNGLVYFTMTDNSTSKIDLWKTDGTEAGTVRIYENCQSQLQAYNNQVYFFIAGTPDQFNNVSYSMRRHNGTTGGFVKSIGSSTQAKIPRFFGVVNNLMLFAADGTITVTGNSVNSGMELWKSDGTSAGTTIVKDINPEPANSFPGMFQSGKDAIEYANQSVYLGANVYVPDLKSRSIIHNNVLYFNATDGALGREVWKSDGTEAGTTLVKNVSDYVYNLGFSGEMKGSDPRSFYVYNSGLVFTAINNSGKLALHKTDGTSANTLLLKDDLSDAGPFFWFLNSFATLNNTLYFDGQGAKLDTYREIWSSDGTPEGTKLFKNLTKLQSTNPTEFYSWNNSLYFRMHPRISTNVSVEPIESELWKFTPAACPTPAPAGPLATSPTILASYTALVESNGCPGTVRWYAAQTGGSPIFTGDNYTTPLLTNSTTYYLTCSVNNCESQRSPATVTVNQPTCTTLPSPPTSASASVVSGNNTTLSALGCTEQTRWYNQPTSGTLLAQTSTYTTPNLTTPTTYYPVCFVQGCESNRTVAVQVGVTPSSGLVVDFDGVDDAITVPANAGFNAQSYTMEAWVRFDVNNRSQTIMDNSQRWITYTYAQAGSSLTFGFADNGSARGAGFSFVPAVGTWYHLAGTFSNVTKEMSFYLNGELQDVQTVNYAPSQTNFPMKLGTNYSVAGYDFDGRIDEARYWNLIRSEAQIGAGYATELTGNESGLVFYYKFDNASSSADIDDCSPNALHGIRSGATGTNNKPQFFNTGVVLTNVACGACLPLTIAAGSNSPVCAGTPLSLTSSGGITYTWRGPNSFTSVVQNPTIPNPTSSATGTYTVIVTNALGCTGTATISVLVNPAPVVTLSSNSPVCAGGTLSFSAASAGTGFVGVFNAANSQYVNVSQSLPTDNFTIEMWIKTDQVNTGLFQVGNEPGEGLSADRFIFIEGGIVKARVIPQATPGFSSGETVNDNTWHHIALTHTTTGGVGSKLYVDGILVATAPTSAGCLGSSKFQLGTENNLAWQNGSYRQYFSGQMDNVRIWNVVRTDAELLANWAAETPASITGLIYQQKFDNNVNATVGTNGTTPNGLYYSGSSYSWSGPNAFTSTAQNPTIFNATASAAGTYTLTVTGVNGCVSTTTIAATVASPTAPTASGANITSGSSATLTATGCATYNWYSQPTGGSAIFTGQPFVTSALNTTTNYYVACTGGSSCESARTLVVVTVGATCSQMVSVKTGNWTDPTVWSCNRIPVAGDVITVATTHVVTIGAGVVGVCKTVQQQGRLVFGMGGRLQLGQN